MQKHFLFSLGICAVGAAAFAPKVQAQGGAALITFSDEVGNAANPIDPNYQPLLNAYPTAGGNTDGANVGVTIGWVQSGSSTDQTSNTAVNPGVNDHTHQVTPTDNSNVILYDNNAQTMTMTFSQPVLLQNFYYAYFNNGVASPIFTGYTNIGDTTPAITVNGSYPGGSYQWQSETGLATTPVQEVTFARNNGQYLQLDDMTISTVAVPEPSTLLAGFSTLTLAAASRFRRRP